MQVPESDAPIVLEYFPKEHPMQSDALLVLEYLPGGHAVQSGAATKAN